MNTKYNDTVTLRDVLSVPNTCVDGVKAWFEANDLDFKKFAKHGMSRQLLIDAVGDDHYLAETLRIKDGK